MKYFVTATEILPKPSGERRTSVWLVDRDGLFATVLDRPFGTYEEAQIFRKELIEQDDSYDYEIFSINL